MNQKYSVTWMHSLDKNPGYLADNVSMTEAKKVIARQNREWKQAGYNPQRFVNSGYCVDVTSDCHMWTEIIPYVA